MSMNMFGSALHEHFSRNTMLEHVLTTFSFGTPFREQVSRQQYWNTLRAMSPGTSLRATARGHIMEHFSGKHLLGQHVREHVLGPYFRNRFLEHVLRNFHPDNLLQCIPKKVVRCSVPT